MLNEFKCYSKIPRKTFVNPSKNDPTWSLQSSSIDNESDFWMKYCIWNSAFMKYFLAERRRSHRKAAKSSIISRFISFSFAFRGCCQISVPVWMLKFYSRPIPYLHGYFPLNIVKQHRSTQIEWDTCYWRRDLCADSSHVMYEKLLHRKTSFNRI